MTWTFDASRFDREVLEPALREELPRSYFVRYQLPEDVSDDALIKDALKAVKGHAGNRQNGKYRNVAERFLSEHPACEAALSAEGGRKAHRERLEQLRRADRARLADELTGIRAGGRYLRPARVAELVRRFRELPAGDVARLVGEAGLTVSEPMDLSAISVPANEATISKLLGTLGHADVLYFVLGDTALDRGYQLLRGFRSLAEPSARLDMARLDARAAQTVTRTDATATAANELIGLLRRVVTADADNGLRLLALAQLAQDLRSDHDKLGVGQSWLSQAAQRRGLVLDEADTLAFAIAEEEDAGSDLQAAIAEGRLREALRLAAVTPAVATNPDLAALVAGAKVRAAEADQLKANAERLLAAGDSEGAARALLAAGSLIADDPSFDEALLRCRPSPPAAVRVRSDDALVFVDWDASPSDVGRITYRVIRAVGRPPARHDDGEIVAEAVSAPVLDNGAPAGVQLHYAVVTVRDGATFSAPSAAAPVVFVPPVRSFQLTAAESEVEGRWSAPPRAQRVVIVRNRDRSPGSWDDGRVIAESTSGYFRDSGLQPGTTYYYRITAVYLLEDGTETRASGVVASATPQLPPEPVSDLRTTLEEELRMARLDWTAPPSGEVRLFVSASPPSVAPGAETSVALIERTARPLNSPARRRADGRFEVLAPIIATEAYYLPVTVAGTRVVAGTARRLTALLPVTDLRGDVSRDEVLVTWVWPPSCQQVVVSWRVGEPPSSTDEGLAAVVARQAYLQDSGFRVATAEAGIGISVFAAVPSADGTIYSRPASLAKVRPPSPELSYELISQGLLRRQVAVRLCVPEGVSDSPEFVLVAGTNGVRPVRPDQGEELVRIPAGTTDGRLFPVRRPKEGYLRGFLEGPGADNFVLRDPPARQIRPTAP